MFRHSDRLVVIFFFVRVFCFVLFPGVEALEAAVDCLEEELA